MKSFIQWYQYKLLSPFNQPITFNKACILSMLMHGILFLVLALVVHLFESPSLYTPPLVFDFVFAPAQDYDRSSLNRDDLKETFDSVAESQKEQPAETRTVNRPEKKWARIKTTSKLFDEKKPPKLENSDLPAINLTKQTGLNKTAVAITVQEEFSAEELVEPDFVPEEKNMFTTDNQFIISAVAPTSLSLPKINVRQPDLFPAKIGMSPKQYKMLLKKFKKWSENLNRMDWPDSSIVWKHKGKVYSARLHHIPAKAETGIEEVLIEVSTKENGYQLSSEMRMKRLAFSNFAQFVDYWDPWVAIHNDVFNGRFHTNTTFSVSEARGIRPEFHGKVTTASYDIHTSGSSPFLDRQAVFLGGIETGVKEIRLPRTHLSFASDSSVSQNQVHAFNEEAWITFRGDGSYIWKTASALDKVHRQTLSKKSYYLIGSRKKKLHLKGVVKGKVLVYSPGKIIIDDDLTYARHPEIAYNADDYLGLVSDKDIEVADPSVTGPGDLYIFAALYAKGRFRVRHLYGSGKATLYIYGSLTAGSLSATEPRYATNVRFDKRLETRRPPNFPMTERYEMIEWDGQWRVKKN